jgi:hypothetical protein
VPEDLVWLDLCQQTIFCRFPKGCRRGLKNCTVAESCLDQKFIRVEPLPVHSPFGRTVEELGEERLDVPEARTRWSRERYVMARTGSKIGNCEQEVHDFCSVTKLVGSNTVRDLLTDRALGLYRYALVRA